MEAEESFPQATDMHAAISQEHTADDAAILPEMDWRNVCLCVCVCVYGMLMSSIDNFIQKKEGL